MSGRDRTQPDAATDARKVGGVHYTPPALAAFLARRALSAVPPREPLRVLDPACGDGELLLAVFDRALADGRTVELFGIDRDEDALARARERVAARARETGAANPWQGAASDFLDLTTEALAPQRRLFPRRARELALRLSHAFDLVIANPPYVRTQWIGAKRARRLREAFGLKGRVDLYHAFARGASQCLANGGVLALLCSNRFLSTLSGESMRRALLEEYAVLEVFDLGDTRLFDASVLPAIIVARRGRAERAPAAAFARVYEARGDPPPDAAPEAASLFDALSGGVRGAVRIADAVYEVERGTLARAAGGGVWTLANDETRAWLECVERHTALRFRDCGRVRVGIKTTADPVFVRDDWDDLPVNVRPEPELLRPLLTHRQVARFEARPDPKLRVLYPHEVSGGRRRAVDLDRYPGARAWLLRHRPRLEERRYVRAAGRRWYEIWVPQDPAAWARRKLVFPDISERARFALDESGAVVQGDCYWIALHPDRDDDLLLLMLGVANGSFSERFYDLAFGNRLYAGRRRYITQYVERFPLPDPRSAAAREIVACVRARLASGPGAAEAARCEATLESLVNRAFGVE